MLAGRDPRELRAPCDDRGARTVRRVELRDRIGERRSVLGGVHEERDRAWRRRGGRGRPRAAHDEPRARRFLDREPVRREDLAREPERLGVLWLSLYSEPLGDEMTAVDERRAAAPELLEHFSNRLTGVDRRLLSERGHAGDQARQQVDEQQRSRTHLGPHRAEVLALYNSALSGDGPHQAASPTPLLARADHDALAVQGVVEVRRR